MPKDKKKGKPPAIPEHIVRRMVAEAEEKANKEGSGLALVLMLTVLLDKYNAADYIRDVYNDWNKLAEEVIEGRVKLHELRGVLRKEYGIRI